MNRERINDYIDCWAKAIQVPREYVDVIKELLPSIIEKYSKEYGDSVSVESDKYKSYVIGPKNGEYSMEEFFLNRLLRNIWSFGNITGSKGDYTAAYMEINFNEAKIQRQLKGQIDERRADFPNLDAAARKKVIMHEVEHALQTKYSSQILDIRFRDNYRKIIEEIQKYKNGKYRNETRSYDELMKGEKFGEYDEYLFSGLHCSGKVRKFRTYREVEGFDNLNEIFNESESLEMAKCSIQGYKMYGKGIYRELRNAESSNTSITNYGYLIKTLLGTRTTFKGMYLNPNEVFTTFNQRYSDIFKKYFENDKDAWENLIIQIDKIKKTDSLQEHLFLQEILSECLDKKISHDLKCGVSKEILISQIRIFKENCMWGETPEDRRKLPHFHILKSTKEKVEEHKKIEITNR